MSFALECREVAFSYPGMPVFRDLSLGVEEGEFVAVLGPNGAGKTTLVRLATRVARASKGTVRLRGDPIEGLSAREVGRRVAVVPQEEASLFSFSVEEVVLMGRNPWLSGFGFEGREDREIAARCLEAVEAGELARRDLAELSGGERQRVLLARALAQRAGLLMLDEPISHLDLRHRVGMLRLLARLRDEEDLTVMVISHEVNLASRFADRVVLLADGGVAADGRTEEVMTAEILSRVYRTPVVVRRIEGVEGPQVFPE